jgi:hypothetical protein
MDLNFNIASIAIPYFRGHSDLIKNAFINAGLNRNITDILIYKHLDYLESLIDEVSKERIVKILDIESLVYSANGEYLFLEPQLSMLGDVEFINITMAEIAPTIGEEKAADIKSDSQEIACRYFIGTDENERITFIGSCKNGQILGYIGNTLKSVLREEVYELIHKMDIGSTDSFEFGKAIMPGETLWTFKGVGVFQDHILPEGFDGGKSEYVLNNIPIDIAVWNLEHRYEFLNKTSIKNDALRSWIIGKSDFEYMAYRELPIQSAIRRRMLFNRAVLTRQAVQWIEKFTKDNNNYSILRVYEPVLNKKGIPQMVYGYAINVTQAINSETTLNHLKSAFDNAQAPMALCGADNVIYYSNKSFRDLLNIHDNQESLLVKRWFEFCTLDNQFKVMNEVLPALIKNPQMKVQLEWQIDRYETIVSQTQLSLTEDNQLLIMVDPIEIIEE